MANLSHRFLAACARQARWVLVLGLLVGLLLPDLAVAFKPTIPWFIVALLFTASLRIGPKHALGALSELHKHLYITVILQMLLPMFVLTVVVLTGLHSHYATGLILLAAAAPISGSPNFVMMLGFDPAPALRQLVIGTALLPLTLIPVLYWMPEFGDTTQLVSSVLRLLVVIAVATALGFGLRARWLPELTERAIDSLDGISAILMTLVVIGVMWSLGDAIRSNPWLLAKMLVVVFAANFGLQLIGCVFWNKTLGEPYTVSMSVISGNRNLALYLTALPASVTEDLYLFIGCYQIPMYLTPLLLRRLYRSRFPFH